MRLWWEGRWEGASEESLVMRMLRGGVDGSKNCSEE